MINHGRELFEEHLEMRLKVIEWLRSKDFRFEHYPFMSVEGEIHEPDKDYRCSTCEGLDSDHMLLIRLNEVNRIPFRIHTRCYNRLANTIVDIIPYNIENGMKLVEKRWSNGDVHFGSLGHPLT